MDKLVVARSVLKQLKQAGYESYFAGGCVRDRLLGVEPKDYDIATAATPDQVQALFPKTVPVGVQFGVILVIESGENIEVATFRTEGSYSDGRRPDQVVFADLASDAKRRDFTVNGLYWDGESEQIVDLVGGVDDLRNKRIRTIGDPQKRFREDHLRMLRAIRFSVQLGFEIEAATIDAIKKLGALVAEVSSERIRDELSKMLVSARPAEAMRLLDRCGLFPAFLPEVLVMKGVEQPIEYHPEGDVFIHTMMLLDLLERPELALALGALFHDIAKPATFVRAADRIRFHGHDRIGAEMTRTILKRLCFPNETVDLVCSLVAEHLRFKDAFNMRTSTLKRFLSLDRFDLHLELHRIDCSASHGKLEAYDFCRKKLEEFGQAGVKAPQWISGKDLIELGLKPGPSFSKILTAIEDQALEGKITSREEAMSYVKANFLNSGEGG